MFGFRNGTFAGLGLKIGNFTAGFVAGFAEEVTLDALGGEPANAVEINIDRVEKTLPLITTTASAVVTSSKVRTIAAELIAGALPNLLF